MPHAHMSPPAVPGTDCSPWPAWVAEFRTDDDAFAAAYDTLSSLERAVIKQALARLFAVHDPGGPLWARRCSLLSRDLEARSVCRPRPWAVVAMGPDFVSPARLLAACLPAVRARAGTLAVVRVHDGSPWPPALLAALELAGVETAFELTPVRMGRFFSETVRKAPGGVVVDFGPAGHLPAGVRGIRCAPAGRLGVWRPAARAFDLSVLAFAHPGSRVEVWGKASGLPEGFMPREGGFDDFLASGYDAVFVPRAKLQAALDAPSGPVLALGPGMECFWGCPGLSVADFLETRQAFGPVGRGRGGNCP